MIHALAERNYANLALSNEERPTLMQRDLGVRVRLSRLGWQFAFIGVCAMIGGAVRAYNLPLVLAGLLVAALLLHWRWGRQTIWAVSVERRLPDEAFAGQPFVVPFLVTNHSRWLPAWLLRIDDTIAPSGSGGQRRGAWYSRPWYPSVWFKARAAADHTVQASCGIGVVPGGRAMIARYDCVIGRRGRYDFGPSRISTGIPLGLMIAERSLRDRESFYVFPQRVTLSRRWRQVLQSRVGGSAAAAQRSGSHEGEFFGIRGWQAGDSRRWIHWRTTARIGEPAVRQFEQQRRFELCILVDAYLQDAPSDAIDEPLERVISTAATLVTAMVATPTNRIGLVLAGQTISSLTSGGGREQTIAMLRHLSELGGTTRPDLVEAVRQMIRTAGRPQDLLILSPRAITPEIQELVDLIGSRSLWRWCAVADGSIDQLLERSLGEGPAVESHNPVPHRPTHALSSHS